MSALDHPGVPDETRAAYADIADHLFAEYGAAILESPRPLAIAHETGHVVIALTEGMSIEATWVECDTFGNRLKKDGWSRQVIRQTERAGKLPLDLNTKIWTGWTSWDASPWPGDLKGSNVDLTTADFDLLAHHVKLIIGGVVGEFLLHGKPQPGSSLDELILCQSLCANWAASRGESDVHRVQAMFGKIYEQACNTITANMDLAAAVLGAFLEQDRLDGDFIANYLTWRPPTRFTS
jgi:hypothetical protein